MSVLKITESSADVLLKSGTVKEAFDKYMQAAQMYISSHGEKSSELIQYLRITIKKQLRFCHMQIEKRRFPKAVKALNGIKGFISSFACHGQLTDEKVKLLNKLWFANMRNGNPRKALIYANSALEESSTALQKGYSYISLNQVFNKLKNYSEALACCTEAAKLAEDDLDTMDPTSQDFIPTTKLKSVAFHQIALQNIALRRFSDGEYWQTRAFQVIEESNMQDMNYLYSLFVDKYNKAVKLANLQGYKKIMNTHNPKNKPQETRSVYRPSTQEIDYQIAEKSSSDIKVHDFSQHPKFEAQELKEEDQYAKNLEREFSEGSEDFEKVQKQIDRSENSRNEIEQEEHKSSGKVSFSQEELASQARAALQEEMDDLPKPIWTNSGSLNAYKNQFSKDIEITREDVKELQKYEKKPEVTVVNQVYPTPPKPRGSSRGSSIKAKRTVFKSDRTNRPRTAKQYVIVSLKTGRRHRSPTARSASSDNFPQTETLDSNKMNVTPKSALTSEKSSNKTPFALRRSRRQKLKKRKQIQIDGNKGALGNSPRDQSTVVKIIEPVEVPSSNTPSRTKSKTPRGSKGKRSVTPGRKSRQSSTSPQIVFDQEEKIWAPAYDENPDVFQALVHKYYLYNITKYTEFWTTKLAQSPRKTAWQNIKELTEEVRLTDLYNAVNDICQSVHLNRMAKTFAKWENYILRESFGKIKNSNVVEPDPNTSISVTFKDQEILEAHADMVVEAENVVPEPDSMQASPAQLQIDPKVQEDDQEPNSPEQPASPSKSDIEVVLEALQEVPSPLQRLKDAGLWKEYEPEPVEIPEQPDFEAVSETSSPEKKDQTSEDLNVEESVPDPQIPELVEKIEAPSIKDIASPALVDKLEAPSIQDIEASNQSSQPELDLEISASEQDLKSVEPITSPEKAESEQLDEISVPSVSEIRPPSVCDIPSPCQTPEPEPFKFLEEPALGIIEFEPPRNLAKNVNGVLFERQKDINAEKYTIVTYVEGRMLWVYVKGSKEFQQVFDIQGIQKQLLQEGFNDRLYMAVEIIKEQVELVGMHIPKYDDWFQRHFSNFFQYQQLLIRGDYGNPKLLSLVILKGDKVYSISAGIQKCVTPSIFAFSQDDTIIIDINSELRLDISLGSAASLCGLPMTMIKQIIRVICQNYIYFDETSEETKAHIQKDQPPIDVCMNATRIFLLLFKNILQIAALKKTHLQNLLYRWDKPPLFDISGEKFQASVYFNQEHQAKLQLYSTSKYDTIEYEIENEHANEFMTSFILKGDRLDIKLTTDEQTGKRSVVDITKWQGSPTKSAANAEDSEISDDNIIDKEPQSPNSQDILEEQAFDPRSPNSQDIIDPEKSDPETPQFQNQTPRTSQKTNLD